MDLIYRAKKPETIKRFLYENNVPLKLIEVVKGKLQLFINNELKLKEDSIKKGEYLRVVIPDEKLDESVKKEDITLDIRYEDEYFLIVNKPADMQIMISKAHPGGTLANAINHYYETNGIHSQIHFINRLDKETSGLVLVAKNRFLKFLFSDRTENQITKEYYAILDGILDNKRSCIDLPISRIEGSVIREVSQKGEECRTTYAVEKEFGHFSLVRILSETGRTHQIRVHFSFFNYPIVGDEIYNKSRYQVKNLLLCCNKIAFMHPLKEQMVEVQLPLPQAFTDFMSKQGA